MCVNVCVSYVIYDFCAFSLAHSLCLFCPITICLILVFIILFYHYYLDSFLFSHDKEGIDLNRTEGMEDLRRAGGWKIVIRNIV